MIMMNDYYPSLSHGENHRMTLKLSTQAYTQS